MLRHVDITARKEEARDLVQITEASLALLDLIFPRHIIEYMTGEAANTGATACYCLPACLPACYCLPATGKAANTGATACYCLLLPATDEPANTGEVGQLAAAAATAAGSSATQQGLAVAGSKPSAASLCLRTLKSGNDFRHLTTHHEQVSKMGGGLGQRSVSVVGWVCKVCGGAGL